MYPTVTDDFERAFSHFSGLSNGLAVLGFRTVTDLLNGRPGVGYLKVSDEMTNAIGYADVSLSAAVLHHRHLKEALLQGKYINALADSVFRCIQDNGRVRREGWGNTPSPDDMISVLSSWSATAKGAADDCGYDVTPAIDKAWQLIWNAPPPKGWKPRSGEDPIIKSAIEEAFRGVCLTPSKGQSEGDA